MEKNYYELQKEMGKDIHFEVDLELMQKLLDKLKNGEWGEYECLNLKCEKVMEVHFSITQRQLCTFLNNLEIGVADLTDFKRLICENIDAYTDKNNAGYHIPRYKVRVIDEKEYNEDFGSASDPREILWGLREEEVKKLQKECSYGNNEKLIQIFNDSI